MNASIQIRDAVVGDLPAINDIYNHFVLHSTCSYQTEPDTAEIRAAWFARHGPRHPVIVAVIDGQIVGWGSLSPLHDRAAYRFTVENSVYVAHTHHRRGIGMALLKELIARARTAGHHTMIASIDAEQTASVALHTAARFVRVAFLKEVGYKFDSWLHVIYMQLML